MSDDLELLIVAAICLVALIAVIRFFMRSLRGNGCGSCSNCHSDPLINIDLDATDSSETNDPEY